MESGSLGINERGDVAGDVAGDMDLGEDAGCTFINLLIIKLSSLILLANVNNLFCASLGNY